MLKLTPPNYQYCPFCGRQLSTRKEEGKTRKYCSSCKWTYYPSVTQAAAAMITKDHQVLLVKRTRPPYQNTWMFPAGFVDYGEHPEDTLIREVKEETGLTAKKSQLIKVLASTDDPREPGHLVFFYLTTAIGTLRNLDPEENSQIKWFNLDHLPQIGWQNHQQMLTWLQQHPSST